ncbi:GH36-type glycosyl hydrolase domain-containing protein [Ancylobacter sp. TS-1]|uniref:GH36-type glycosyl hydrolase domain-containing protein n=1 Tax=Ancylobacter sp. TS-1 TaxID=1850374 RepID=UPI001265CF81|nr:glucoamylase family protein [Ancylobacter sp. TS-1]QFR33497.1 glycosyl transferase [Ancylobacter sp. TS-1]
MNPIADLRRHCGSKLSAWRGRAWRGSVWDDASPIREEMFGAERLEQHARSLATAQPIAPRPRAVPALHARLESNAGVLLAAYRATATDAEAGRPVVPAAEWLLDNYHLVEEQVREIRDDLPPGYYRQLPKLAEGPFAGYPRVLGLAWAYVAHTDSHFDPEMLRRFIAAYQQVEPLTIGELWAVAITLRIVLIENLRRLADQISDGRRSRREADLLADRLLASGEARAALDADILNRSPEPLNEVFAAQLVKRLRDQDPRSTPALGWIEARLDAQHVSVDDVVQHAQQRLGASNVTVRNVITSMRLISDIDWAELFESVSLVDARLRAGSAFAAMDFPTRNLYRSAIEQLARGALASELDIAGLALEAAAAAPAAAPQGAPQEALPAPGSDPGYYLIGAGRSAFERTIQFRPPARLRLGRLSIRLGIGGYIGAILAVTLGLIALALWALVGAGLSGGWLGLFALAFFFPVSAAATALVNRGVAWMFGATSLPGLELADGVPASLRTLIAVPTLLTSEADLLAQIEGLEIHFLSGASGDFTFALLSDGIDAESEVMPGDARLLELAIEGVDLLNRRHGPGPGGDRFLLLHRHRRFNPGEGTWMGWERKRGKLHELNRLLRGADDTSFMTLAGRAPWVPANVRYVITLDVDTRLPRDAALRLVGKMAHPLNRPRFDAAAQRVVGGYGILQPRVTPSLPIGREGSFYQRIISGGGGMDPYAAAVSDVYQDLFGEGSYTGKGIYDIDAFEAALAGRIPDNTLLSHDLLEGVFARAGLASDVEVVEEFPSRYDVVAKREHRWMRGDWQLLPWMFGAGAGRRGLTPVGRGKMLDNLRRSTLAPLTLLVLCVCWLFPLPAALVGTGLVIATLAVPNLLPILSGLLPRRPDIRLRSHLSQLLADIRLATAQTWLSLIFLPDQAWRAGDAAIRTLLRLCVTRRHLLAWTSAATSSTAPRLGGLGFYRQMAGSTALALALAAGALALAPLSWSLVLPFALLWLAAPAIAQAVSRSPKVPPRLKLGEAPARELRLIARRTWRFFETFVTPADNMLPPDNFQEVPKPVIAHRTSPTNIGLYLLSAVAARDFGWAGTLETIERLEATFATLKKLPRFRGHFFNWYGTQDLAPLPPDYVSSVDSGNLAGHLIALANACEEWADAPVGANARQGLADTLALARGALAELPTMGSSHAVHLTDALDAIGAEMNSVQTLEMTAPVLKRLTDKAGRIAQEVIPGTGGNSSTDFMFWIEALGRAVGGHQRDHLQFVAAPEVLRNRLIALADTARSMAMEMDFAFLLDPERKLLSIGYSLTENGLDPSCYDLLASEARLASLFAIAKGDAPTRHWFRLGRLSTPLGTGSALISWSGSMFEYLMPSLVMRAPAGSVLEQTNGLVVERQRSYAAALGIPWGMSESAYNARDIEFTYQYGNFGVPGLGLKRGLSENSVIAPYATGLATMVDADSARQNFARLAALGAKGRYGFYEALDFTRSRVPENQVAAIVRSFMAHHQGMTIVAIANTLLDGEMRARFHREPMIRATELLLQERSPRDVVVARPRAEEVRAAALDARGDAVTVRRLSAPTAGAPVTHLLSNGGYAVMMTAKGGGYSRWRDIAVTRWREDATRDDWGSFIFLRDLKSGATWSATTQPVAGEAGEGEVVFGEDHAEFIRRDPGFTTAMDVIVSGEHNGEVRRVCLTNSGRRSREIELTSYAELVLATPAVDAAHPAFAKMFVVTEHLPEFGALIATRRLRAPGEPQIWAAHFAVVEGELAADPQYETARAAFIGRGRSIGMAGAMAEGRPLSNTVGTVLDPIFSLRQSVRIAPGKIARVAFWTMVASTREELLDLIDTHHDRNAFDRARTLAWTQAQVQLRHIAVGLEEAADFQRLAAPLLYADRRFRSSSDVILRGAGPQSGLWQHAISGDLPIVLLRIDDIEDIAQVRQLLRAREYWRMKRLAVDLVIINERASSYVQDLQIAIETAVRTSASRPLLGEEPAMGSVHVLRADLMSVESRALLHSVARVVLLARRGGLAEQLARVNRLPEPSAPRAPARPQPTMQPHMPAPAPPALEFFNGLGGFDKDGREYVTVLGRERTTPAPWINVVANAGFGFQISAEGSGYSWAQNSRENQLTQWSNDAVVDPTGEAIYVRDEVSGELWSPTAQPIRDGGTYVARHGFGYSRFTHEANGIGLDLLHFVPLDDPIKISRLTLTNLSGRPRRLSVTTYAEWVLGTARGASAPFIATERDGETGALLARNPWSSSFASRVTFADLGGRQSAWTADRTEFLGRNGGLDAPRALTGGAPLSGAAGAGLDPCAALQTVVELGIGESVDVVAFLGQCASLAETRALIARYRQTDLDAVLATVTAHWDAVLGTVQVKTPDRAMDIMLNGWLLYQTLACRITARSAFYQASGAYGFRDQLQDGMALTLALPDETRGHILRAAGRQFVEGDVQHWWLPQSGQGVRTRISDDVVWLAYATATYIGTTGDAAILDESVPYLDGPPLAPGEHDHFFQPMPADETGPLFEHCARGLDLALARTGPLGLPLMGTGDWNDGMNRVGEGGQGESVWLGWLLIRTIEMFAPLAESRDPESARRWRAHAASVRRAIERSAWGGDWYRRATFDDGTWLGSKDSGECCIDSIAQSWAVLSGAADSLRAATAMASLERHLICTDRMIAPLFAPPFEKTPHDPGYIKGYPPGLRENGGQYSHAAMWAVLAFARLGEGDKAHALFALLNPINHARTPEETERYKTEPYVVAADVYSVAPHAGRGGWSWYTGSAGWMHRAGVEGLLGIRRQGDVLIVEPTLPASWPGFEATVTLGETICRVEVRAIGEAEEGASRWGLDAAGPVTPGGSARIPLDGRPHALHMRLRRR